VVLGAGQVWIFLKIRRQENDIAGRKFRIAVSSSHSLKTAKKTFWLHQIWFGHVDADMVPGVIHLDISAKQGPVLHAFVVSVDQRQGILYITQRMWMNEVIVAIQSRDGSTRWGPCFNRCQHLIACP